MRLYGDIIGPGGDPQVQYVQSLGVIALLWTFLGLS